MDLSDSVAVVTGASSGVGEATARTLADEGCAVTLVARREDRLEAIADDVDGETLVAPADVSDEAEVEAAVDATREAFGGIDVLVNNAAILRGDPVADADLADLHRHVEVNLLGTMNATHAALPDLLEGDGGHVVTVSSMNAKFPAAGASAYTASKFGVNGFARALRREVSEEPVRVTIVMPGPIQSEMKDWSDWEGRALDPEDVADSIRYVVSRPDHVEIPDITVNTTDKV
jgi:NADP-dependent 3-hydroxy acid dehydrogenase YdfG